MQIQNNISSKQKNSSFIELSSETRQNAVIGANLGSKCLRGFLNSLNAPFCYKKNGDAGTPPILCSCGYSRNGALCYVSCPPNYTIVAGICWEICGSGYTDIGAICFNNIFDFYFKGTQIDDSGLYSNFDDRAACYFGYYKFGALCYRDCANIGMVNCGIGACATSSNSCLAGILTIATNLIIGFTSLILFVVTFGGSTATEPELEAIKVTARTSINALSAGAKESISVLTRIANSPVLKSKFIQTVVKNSKKIGLVIAGPIVSAVCSKVGDAILSMTSGANGVSIKDTGFDPSGITNLINNCNGELMDLNSILLCENSIITVLSNIDPTGLTSIAIAGLQPICDV